MPRLLWLAALAIPFAIAQSDPAFEVASIKPNPAGEQAGLSWDISPDGRLTARNTPLWIIIRFAYGLRELQLSGGPDWVKSQGFDIQAAPEGTATREQTLAMVRTLLRDRFQLKLRTESREMPAYALVIGKDGHRLKPSTAERPNRTQIGNFNVQKMSVKTLAQILEFDLDRPLIDQTGLAGDFAFTLEWTPEQQRTAANPQANPVYNGPPRPSIFEALQEQLGLKLESAKAPIEVTVIESVERPSDN